MEIKIGKDTADRLAQASHRLGHTTPGLLLGRVLNKLREKVPPDQRDGIMHIANGSGKWTPGTEKVELTGVEMERTLQECAKALGLSVEDAFERGVDALLGSTPSTVQGG